MSLIFIIALMYVQINLVNKREGGIFLSVTSKLYKNYSISTRYQRMSRQQKSIISVHPLLSQHACHVISKHVEKPPESMSIHAITLKNHRIDKDNDLISLK